MAMKQVGEIFRQTRKEKGLSLDQVIEATKIPASFLKAIESDNYSILPSGLYPQLYVRTYAKVLELPPQKMEAIFRRDYQNFEKKEEVSVSVKVGLSSGWQKLVGIAFLVLLFLSYLVYQYFNFVYPPKVKVSLVDSPSGVKILKGKTDSRATLTIEGRLVSLDERGNFIYEIGEEDGEIITIMVESPSGKSRTIEKNIGLDF